MVATRRHKEQWLGRITVENRGDHRDIWQVRATIVWSVGHKNVAWLHVWMGFDNACD